MLNNVKNGAVRFGKATVTLVLAELAVNALQKGANKVSEKIKSAKEKKEEAN